RVGGAVGVTRTAERVGGDESDREDDGHGDRDHDSGAAVPGSRRRLRTHGGEQVGETAFGGIAARRVHRHSLLSASIGASRAARDAGYTPKTTPMPTATTIAPSAAGTEITTCELLKAGIRTAPRRPSATPRIPPASPSTDASTRN